MKISCSILLPSASSRQETPRTRQVREWFGLTMSANPHSLGHGALHFAPGQITLVVGPSGSGKSLLLQTLARRLGNRAIRADHLQFDPHASVVDAVPLPLKPSLKLLAACGLAEARALVARPDELSDGQRHRLRLAVAIARSRSRQVLILDEFGATLDRLTAMLLAQGVRKLADRRRLTLLLATTHLDLFDALRPDVVVYKPLTPGLEIFPRSTASTGNDPSLSWPTPPPRRHSWKKRGTSSMIHDCGPGVPLANNRPRTAPDEAAIPDSQPRTADKKQP